ncbi:MAG: FHA domain-containing protein [Proteobacteria bacterium]|nr:FHA domain-containing protein [Pseudomonadota bacterium]
MICSNCGKTIADNYRFCQYCGAATDASSARSSGTLDPIRLPSANMTTPDSLEDWLRKDTIESVEISDPNTPAISSDTSASDSADSEFHSLDLPLLEVNSEDFVPVDVPAETVSNQPADSMKTELDNAPDRLQQNLERTCRSCGAILAPGHHYCGNCGCHYDSGHEFTPPSPNPANVSGAKVAIERTSFIPERQQLQPDAEQAEFVLCHICDDGSAGEEIPLWEGENIIGRGSSSLLSTDRFVNPKHLRLVCTQSQVSIEDFNSLNGVFIRLTNASTEIRNGDVFRIGEELLCYFHGNSVQPLLSNQGYDQTQLLGSQESPGWGYLRIVMGAYCEGSVYRLCQPTVSLGRTHANILFPKDGFVSGTHATLEGMRDHAILTDLNSSNGTFVRLKKPLQTSQTTFILIGNQLLKLRPRR